MKRLMLVLAMAMSIVYAWSKTNTTQIQDKTRLQERIRLEDQIRTRLRERLKTEECDRVCERLFTRIKEGSTSQRQYEHTLSFVNAYMERKGKSWEPEDLIEVGEFYQKNRNRIEGTSREKRNALMLEAENRIRNKAQNNIEETQLLQRREKESRSYSYAYRNRICQGNISENADKARMMRGRREGPSSSGKR